MMPLETKANRAAQYIDKAGCILYRVQEWMKCFDNIDTCMIDYRRGLDW
jgi:hypothetical protein